MAATYATFRQPASRELKYVKVGPSWTMFFFSSLLGVPLFYRGFFRLGAAMLAACVAGALSVAAFAVWAGNVQGEMYVPEGPIYAFVFFTTILYMAVWAIVLTATVMANKWTAVKYYKKGWKIIDAYSDPEKVKKIKMAWSLPDDAFDDTFSGIRPAGNYPG